MLKNVDKLMESHNPSNPVPIKFLFKSLFSDRQCSLFIDVEMCFAMYARKLNITEFTVYKISFVQFC